MDTDASSRFQDLVSSEYAGIAPGYLNTASHGLAPARTAAALRSAVDAWAAGRPDLDAYESAVAAARAAYAGLAGVAVEQVALAGTVAETVGLISAVLPAGAEVVAFEGDFSSLVHPFAARGDLKLRLVPLEGIADAVRPSTALVAVSAAQSADGRVADLAAIRSAAAAAGARILIDGTQSMGWLPLCTDDYDFVVAHGYKWLVSPHGACFLTVREGAEGALSGGSAGWYAAEDRWANCYGPIERLAPAAHAFDSRPAYLPFVGAAASLSLLAELGVDAVHAHDLALAERLREGFAALGYPAVPGDSPIVSVPGAPSSYPSRLSAAGIRFTAPLGALRFALHLHNTSADVDRVLDALA